MDNAGAVFCRDKIAQQHPKRGAIGLDIGHELLVFHTFQVSALDFFYDFQVGNRLVARLDGICLQFRVAVAEIGSKAVFRENYDDGFPGVAVKRADFDIGDMPPYGQSRIRGQRPGGSGPCQEEGIFAAFEAELGNGCRIGNLSVRTGLVQFMRTEARTGSRGEGLYGIPFVQ